MASVRLTADDVVIWTRERRREREKNYITQHFKMRACVRVCILYQRRVLLGAHITLSMRWCVSKRRESTNPSGCDLMHQLFSVHHSDGWKIFEQKTTLSLSIYALSDALDLEQDLYFKSNVSGSLRDLTSLTKSEFLFLYSRDVCIKIYIHRVGLDVCVCISKTRLLFLCPSLSAAVGLF